jgi:3-oxoacyl-[acyl-carrier-protein] synthase-3
MSNLFDTSAEWIVQHSGIHARRVTSGPFVGVESAPHPPDGLGPSGSLAVEAGREALHAAGLTGSDIGLLIVCTTTPDQAMPATSSTVSDALGITGGALDLNAACAGFSYGLITASGIIATGVDRVLLIGADTLTQITDWGDRSSAFLFGDGAGAVVIEAVPGEGSLLGADMGTNGALAQILFADHGERIVMNGPEVFRRAVLATVESAQRSLERAGVAPDDIALFVPHQANVRIMDAVAKRLGLPEGRTASVIEWTGNTCAASIPLALADAVGHNQLHDGDLILIAGFGAGMTWATVVWRWGC